MAGDSRHSCDPFRHGIESVDVPTQPELFEGSARGFEVNPKFLTLEFEGTCGLHIDQSRNLDRDPGTLGARAQLLSMQEGALPMPQRNRGLAQQPSAGAGGTLDLRP